MIPSVLLTAGGDRKAFGAAAAGRGSHPGTGARSFQYFSLASSLFTGHSSPKPDMISQLEREEKLCTAEVHTQRGRHWGKNRAAPVLEGDGPGRLPAFWVLGNLHAAAREVPGDLSPAAGFSSRSE